MDSRILEPGRNVWRVERAARAAVLIDAAAFFEAVRRAFLQAERRIFIAGWDIDSRTRLVGEGNCADDGYSPVLAEFLSEIVSSKPSLEVYLLLWDFSLNYAGERELFPRLSLQWQTPPRVTLCMDNAVPFGSSQHQKLIVIDDALAFSGGLDVTMRRWDCSDHAPDNPERVDASGQPYPPFHDVQMMVDGEAALALAQLVRRRWCNAYGVEPPVEPFGDPWPQGFEPHFRNVEIGIARTQPEFGDQEQVKEVETLFLDSIARAEHSIYIENQFMTAMPVAERLAERLRERPKLELVAVEPKDYDSWVVARTLGAERARFHRMLEAAGGDRVRLVYPTVRQGDASADTMVHSKVMIVDGRFLRVGSANLNNRSMGADTECDLAIEARNESERAAIIDIRNRLLGDHCGVSADAVARQMQSGSLVAAVDRLSGNGHRLCRIESAEPEPSELAEVVTGLIDPEKPLVSSRPWPRVREALSGRGPVIAILVLSVVILAGTVVWSSTAASGLVTREGVQSFLASIAVSGWAPLWVLAIYVAGGLIAFPVVVLIAATAATFGPWFGFVYAVTGVLASALVTFFIGASVGRNAVRSLLGTRWDRARRAIDRRGILALAAIRMVPVAPFSLVNLIAGACSISVFDYVAGTLIGMLPGLIAMSALGYQITALVTEFSARNFALLLAGVAGWIGLAWSAQALVGRLRGHAS
jgi:phospholipase D1/2